MNNANIVLGVESLNNGTWVWTACTDRSDQSRMLGRMRSTFNGSKPLECRAAVRGAGPVLICGKCGDVESAGGAHYSGQPCMCGGALRYVTGEN